MCGVEMMNENRKSEFNMIHQTLTLYVADDPRAEEVKKRMFNLLSCHKTMSQQIVEMKHHLT